jgi:hypothetical protein
MATSQILQSAQRTKIIGSDQTVIMALARSNVDVNRLAHRKRLRQAREQIALCRRGL